MSAATGPAGKAAGVRTLADKEQDRASTPDPKGVSPGMAGRRKTLKPTSSVVWLSNTITASRTTGADSDAVPGSLAAQMESGRAASHAAYGSKRSCQHPNTV